MASIIPAVVSAMTTANATAHPPAAAAKAVAVQPVYSRRDRCPRRHAAPSYAAHQNRGIATDEDKSGQNGVCGRGGGPRRSERKTRTEGASRRRAGGAPSREERANEEGGRRVRPLRRAERKEEEEEYQRNDTEVSTYGW